MVRRYIFIVLMALYSTISLSQSFKGGIIAGLSTSQVDGDTYSGFHRVGLVAGAYVAHDISDKFAWQLEMKYIQKGSYQSLNPDGGIIHTFNLRLNYVEIPFIIKYKYKTKINFEVGLGFAYLAKAKFKDEYGVFPEYLITPFHKTDITYQIGGYYRLYKGLSFNIRYSYSIVPIRQNIAGQRRIFMQWGQFNNGISFSFYYQFNKPNE